MSRPFGVAMLFAGVDQDGPRLYVFALSLLNLLSFSIIKL